MALVEPWKNVTARVKKGVSYSTRDLSAVSIIGIHRADYTSFDEAVAAYKDPATKQSAIPATARTKAFRLAIASTLLFMIDLVTQNHSAGNLYQSFGSLSMGIQDYIFL